MNKLKTIMTQLTSFYKYKDLLILLVQRDIKLKYRRSLLGYLWSVLNPLLIMIVLTVVFSAMFKKSIPNYPVYLLVGRMFFEYMSESTRQGMGSIVSNASLLKKVYIPRYIFTVAKVTSSAVNFLFSLGALTIVMAATRTWPTWHILFLPFTVLQLYLFCLGMALLLAALNVFFRDVQYIYNAVITAWMYLSAIFYPISILPAKARWIVEHLNPMHFYIQQARSLVVQGAFPDLYLVAAGVVVALGSLFFGIKAFRSAQDRFILYI